MLTWELSCPHCGGPNQVSADKYCLTCTYCGAGLWVRLPDDYPTLVARPRVDKREAVFAWDRYLKKQSQPLSRSPRRTSLLYLPFWRITAIVAIQELNRRRHTEPVGSLSDNLFSARLARSGAFGGAAQPSEEVCAGEWQIKQWDVTVPAFARGVFGLDSLGVRVETVPLAGWSGTDDTAQTQDWPLQVDLDHAFGRFAQSVQAVMSQSRDHDMAGLQTIAPRPALIYWPVWILTDQADGHGRGVEIDGVSGRIVRERDGIPVVARDGGQPERRPPELCFHRCTECGQDLDVSDRSVVFICRNCRRMTTHDNSGQRRTIQPEFQNDPRETGGRWYPFWRFEPDNVLVPAFPIRNYCRLVAFGRIMSSPSRSFQRRDAMPSGLVRASLPRDVAAGLAALVRQARKPVLLSGRGPMEECEGEGETGPVCRLVYCPLTASGAELVDPLTGLCLSRSALEPH